MAGALSGNFLWVLNSKDCGGIDKIVAVAQETGYGICAKFHDGDPSDDARWGWQQSFAQLAKRCAPPLNIPLVAWGYCYGDTYGNLDKEAFAAVLALRSGAQAYIIDAEKEWEVPAATQWAQRFMSLVLQTVPGAEIGVTTFWNLRWHPAVPARALRQAGCQVAIPQVYYTLGERETLDARKKMHAISNEDFKGAGYSLVYPAGEFAKDVTDTVDFLHIVGTTPHSFWLLDGYQDSPSMKVLRTYTSACKAAQAGEPDQPAQPGQIGQPDPSNQEELTALRAKLDEVKKAVKVLTELG